MPRLTVDISQEAFALLERRAHDHKVHPHDYASHLLAVSLGFGLPSLPPEAVLDCIALIVGQSTLAETHARAPETVKRFLPIVLKIHDEYVPLERQRLAPRGSARTTGALRLYLAPCALRETIAKVVTIDSMSTWRKPGHTLSWSVADECPDEIVCDVDKFEQVLHNLIGNALKYSPDGGEVRLEVRRDDPQTLAFSVSDQGLGMSPEFLEQFGQKFARQDDPATRAIIGTGIGAFLVKGIVEAHDGRMWAHSDGPGKGSTVSFSLPQQPAQEQEPHHAETLAVLERAGGVLTAVADHLRALPATEGQLDEATAAELRDAALALERSLSHFTAP